MSPPMNRRTLLRRAMTTGAALSLPGVGSLQVGVGSAARGSAPPDVRQRRLIIVVFGGGTRVSESIDDPTHRYIPHLWKEMVPRGALFTNMRVEHKVVHPNCTASILTGQQEWDDLDWSQPVAHPTINRE